MSGLLPKLLMQFQWNFTGFISSWSPCAYITGLLIEWFLAELWPLKKNFFFFCGILENYINHKSCPKLLVRFHPNFTGVISTKSSCAYYHQFYFPMFNIKSKHKNIHTKLHFKQNCLITPQMSTSRRHMWTLITDCINCINLY